MPLQINHNFNSYDTTISAQLEGVTYNLRLRWNDTSKSWYLYIGKQAGQYILKTRLSTNRDLLLPVKYRDDIPKGMLCVWDSESLYGRPTFETLGVDRRFKLWYFTEEELNSV